MKSVFFAILAMIFLGASTINAQRYPPQLTPRQDSIAKAIFADATLPYFDSIPLNSVFDYEKNCAPLFLPLNHNSPSVLFEMCLKKETDTTVISRIRIVDISETSFKFLGSMGTYLSSSKSAQGYYYGHCHAELDEGFYNDEELTGRWIPLDEKARIERRAFLSELPCPSLVKNLTNKIHNYIFRTTKQETKSRLRAALFLPIVIN